MLHVPHIGIDVNKSLSDRQARGGVPELLDWQTGNWPKRLHPDVSPSLRCASGLATVLNLMPC